MTAPVIRTWHLAFLIVLSVVWDLGAASMLDWLRLHRNLGLIAATAVDASFVSRSDVFASIEPSPSDTSPSDFEVDEASPQPPPFDGEDRTTFGTAFWLAFAPGIESHTYSIIFVGEKASTVTVKMAGLGFLSTTSMAPNQISRVELPAFTPQANKVENFGIEIEATSPISVYGLSRGNFSSDGYLAIPRKTLGVSYRVLDWPERPIGRQLTVVATEDLTKVLASGYSVDLMKGEVYVFQNATESGSLVTSNRPIGVIAGHVCGNVPIKAVRYCDHLTSYLPPVESWGKSVLIAPFATRLAGDVVHIIAAEDQTQIYIDDKLEFILEAGGSAIFETPSNQGTWVTADKPFLASQYMKGHKSDRMLGDPSSLLQYSVEQYLTAYTVGTAFDSNNWASVILQNSSIESFKVDGEVPRDLDFRGIGSSRYSYTHLQINSGSHSFSASEPFSVSVYGFGTLESYAYPAGASFKFIK